MSLDSHGARLTRRDVQELAAASEQLAVAAETIRSIGPKWGEAVVNLLIAVNVTIERIQNKGAATFGRYLEKHGPQGAQDASVEANVEAIPDQEPIARPEKEEP